MEVIAPDRAYAKPTQVERAKEVVLYGDAGFGGDALLDIKLIEFSR